MEQEERMNKRISVRSLVEFILRQGDIDNRAGQVTVREAMQMGSALHRKVQGKMRGDYKAEVPLKITWPCTDLDITLEGRADGIFTQDDMTVIDEIKGIVRSLDLLEEPVGVHLAQAKCYAWMYLDRQLEEENTADERIGVRISYANLETEEMKYFHYIYGFDELERMVHGPDGGIPEVGRRRGTLEFYTAGIHTPDGISVPMERRPEETGGRCLPDDRCRKESVYPGTDRHRKDLKHSFPGRESNR